ncbi:MAG TPA: penicillin acylase family protein, partial [Longimicrobium sp.]
GYDAADCYVVETDPAHPRRYRYDGGWREMVTRTVTVPVKGGPAVTRTFEYTRHNGVLSPVVARRGTRAWVAASPYMDQAGRFDEQMYRQLRARSVDELLEANRMLQMWPTNLVAADARGNTLYLRAGRIPIRPPGHDWTAPVDGGTPATAWRGVYPLEALVQLRNPASGYMQNDNVSPDVMFEGSPLTADRYPADVFADRLGNQNFRGRRTVDVLSRTFRATRDDLFALLFDEKWEGAELWTEALRRALNASPALVAARPAEYRTLADRIARFDGFAHRESVAALSYLYWRRALSENPAANREMVAATFRDSVPPARFDSLMRAAVERAGVLLRQDFHSTDRAFGDVFRVGRGGVSLPLGGFVGTMRAMQYSPPDSAGLQWVYSGQRQPLVVIFSDPIQSWSSLNFGESGRPSSPHYADQSRLMSEKRLKPTYFYEADLLPHVEWRRTLTVHR